MEGVTGRGKYIALAVLLLPSLVGMSAFYILPVLSSLVLSFAKWDLLTPIQWIGMGNYLAALADPTVQQALRNTLTFILGYLPAVVAGGLGLALLLNRKLKGRTVFRAIYFVPVVTSWVAVSLVWKWLLNPQYGLVNYGLALIGIKGPGWLFDPNWAMAGVIMTTIWKDIGFVTVIYLAGLQEIPGNLGEASSIDGATPWQRFWSITWPMLAPTTFFVTTISLISSFQVFDQVFVMTGGGPLYRTETVVQYIYNCAFTKFDRGYASAVAVALLMITLAVSAVLFKTMKKDEADLT